MEEDRPVKIGNTSPFYRIPKLIKSYNPQCKELTYVDCDMDSLEGIEAIPVPPLDHEYYYTDQIAYKLQRKATQHKKNGNMQLAIACLRKSNAISDCYEPPTPLLDKDYYRLPKYIELTGDKEGAAIEWERLKQNHPEFWDKRIINKKKIRETLKQNEETIKWPYVWVRTNSVCPVCATYNDKYYTIGALPSIITDGGPCAKHLCSVSPIDDLFLETHKDIEIITE